MKTKPMIAYLVSEYPAISHTFISREIRTLRDLGYQVQSYSIRRPSHLKVLSEDDQEEAKHTLYLKEKCLPNGVFAYLYLLLTACIPTLKMTYDSLKQVVQRPLELPRFIAYLLEAAVLVKSLRGRGIHHLHVHFANPAATVALLANRFPDITYSLSIHGPNIFDNVEKNLLKEKVREAQFVRCISHYCKSQLLRLVPQRLWHRFHIVRCGIDPNRFNSRKPPNNKVPELLCVGRLVPEKGQAVLIEACRILKERGYQFHLSFVGSGSDLLDLIDLTETYFLADRITFAGHVGQDEVHRFYDRADLFVLPSFAEGVPVVLMEAMAKQIPCVTTHITGIPELIDNGSTGKLVPPMHAEALANEIAALLDSPEQREQIGAAARDAVVNKYQLDTNCKDLVALFDAVTNGEAS